MRATTHLAAEPSGPVLHTMSNQSRNSATVPICLKLVARTTRLGSDPQPPYHQPDPGVQPRRRLRWGCIAFIDADSDCDVVTRDGRGCGFVPEPNEEVDVQLCEVHVLPCPGTEGAPPTPQMP